MTQQRGADRRGPNDRGRGTSRRADEARDPGAFIGRQPERATQTIPGGVGPKDRRVSAVATQPGPPAPETSGPPEGHREARPADDATVREAGQDH